MRILGLARTLPPGEILKRLITRPGRALRPLLTSAPRVVDPYEAWLERRQPTPQSAASSAATEPRHSCSIASGFAYPTASAG